MPLIIMRRYLEKVRVGEAIITVSGIRGSRIYLEIDAPLHVRIDRLIDRADPDRNLRQKVITTLRRAVEALAEENDPTNAALLAEARAWLDRDENDIDQDQTPLLEGDDPDERELPDPTFPKPQGEIGEAGA